MKNIETHHKIRRFGKFLFRFTVYICFVSLCFILIFNFQIYPFAASLAKSSSQRKIVNIVNSAAYSALAKGGYSYNDFIMLNYDRSGTVSSLQTNISNINKAGIEIAAAVFSELENDDLMFVSIPIGSLLGGELLSGKGPGVNIKMLLSEGFRYHIDSSLEEKGINQTIHSINIVFNITTEILLPKKTVAFETLLSFPVAQTIIVGEVPEAYTKINRLTDDVTEQELDDLYDFGADKS